MGNDFNRPHEHPTVNLPDHLDLIATTPAGIQKLRSLILELAVRGKLVPQDPNDEPASELLKRIARERARLEAEGTFTKNKATPVVGEDEWPFRAPTGWNWIRLAALGEFKGGKTPSTNRSEYWSGPIPWVSPKDMKSLVVKETEDHVSELALSDGLARIPANSVLIVVRSGILRRMVPVAINERMCAINQDLKALCLVQPALARYVQLIIQGFERLILATLTKVGTTVESIKFDEFSRQPFPLPPLAEQHRIVAKVDELMALCDLLEAEQTDAGAAHARLVETLLGTLTQSADAAELAANWQRLAEHFDTLFTTESSLDALKQTILQLAVMGKLVPQGTGHADPGWAIKRLDKLCPEIVDCPHSTPKWTATGKLCVRTSQFRPGRLDLSASRFVSDSTFSERISRLKPKENDILYSREGGILGVACRVPLGIELCLGQRMMLIRPGRNVSSAFLELVLNSPMITQLAREKTTGGAAPRVNVATVKAYPIPIPPIDEQHRIVAKVDELMALCDRLKAGLAESRAQKERLATTLIESALKAA
jgi:type I restriction enzyme S subunit